MILGPMRPNFKGRAVAVPIMRNAETWYAKGPTRAAHSQPVTRDPLGRG